MVPFGPNELIQLDLSNDNNDIMTWKLFCSVGPLWGESISHGESLHKGAVKQIFDEQAAVQTVKLPVISDAMILK